MKRILIMREININKEFVLALERKMPKKTMLADFIADNLCMEKETAYRRLRGEVPFTLREAGIISAKLGISLDEIILRTMSGGKEKTIMQLPVPSKKEDPKLLEDAINFLYNITDQPYSEFGLALAGIPFALFQKYSLISRFYILKHVHHKGNPHTCPSFEMLQESEEQVQKREEIAMLFQRISYTYYVWDRKIMGALISDIKYYRNVRLIKEEEVTALKAELHKFLNDLEVLTSEGKYKENGNKFELYIADIDIDVTYAYLCSEEICVSLFTSFIYYATASVDEQTCKNVSEWIKSMKRCSTLISGIGDRDRVIFFDQQHAIVDTL